MHALFHIRTAIITRERYRPEDFRPRVNIGREMMRGRIQDFKLGGGGALKKMLGVFRVKNHEFTQIFFLFFPILGRRAGCSPWIRP